MCDCHVQPSVVVISEFLQPLMGIDSSAAWTIPENKADPEMARTADFLMNDLRGMLSGSIFFGSSMCEYLAMEFRVIVSMGIYGLSLGNLELMGLRARYSIGCE